MEGARKRKANATPLAQEGTKKLKLLNSTPAPAKSLSVQDVGHRMLEQLRNAQDKHGRLIATEFLELPPRDELPDYYAFIKLPIALETVEKKVKRNEYPTVTTLESDFKRMVQNAKDYNDPSSQIYEDAEKIRKLVFNQMKSLNPAYSDSKYTSFPTPIPKENAVQNGKRAAESEGDAHRSRTVSERPRRGESERKSSVAPSTANGEPEADEDVDFTGKTMQQAQQMLVNHFLRYEVDGLVIYEPFAMLPSRKIEDYYKLIKHPVSLKGIGKRIQGVHGRAPPTGNTDFKTWDQFESEVSFIWRNAREYNEDGSDMFNLSEEFEQHFKSLLAEAKDKVEGPRLKIAGPKPKVTLNLTQHRNSPGPGVSVDNAALTRQRQMVQAAGNSTETPGQSQRAAASTNGTARPPSQTPQTNGVRPQSSAPAGSPRGTAIKPEMAPTQSPAPTTSMPAPPTGSMPPPTIRPTSSTSSPYPPQVPPTTHHTTTALLPPTPLRPYPPSQALLPTLTLTTHPHLRLPNPTTLTLPPHPTLSHHSATLTLPASHYFLQISPTIARDLSAGRPYKMFVSINGTRVSQRDTFFEGGRRTHVYEGGLAQGVNRVEVEVAAAKTGGGEGLEVEKVTVFVNLMR